MSEWRPMARGVERGDRRGRVELTAATSWLVVSTNGIGRICRLLFEHRVLTTSQVADIGFSLAAQGPGAAGTAPRLGGGGPIPTPLLVGEQLRSTSSWERMVPPSSPPNGSVELSALGWRREAPTALAT